MLLAKSLKIALVFFSLISQHTASAKYLKISDSFNMFYEESGRGTSSVVLVPGWTMSTQVFEHQLRYFKNSTKYRVISYDPRGQGLSSKTTLGHDYSQRGRDLAVFIAQLNLKSIVLVGWSFGVLDVLSYIDQFGIKKLKGLVILDGSPKTMATTRKDSWAWIDQKDSDKTRQYTTLGALNNPEKLFRNFTMWMLEKASEENIRQITRLSYQTPPFVAALTNETASYADYEKTLKNLDKKIPVYVFVRNEWKKVAGEWVKAELSKARFSYMGKHLMFWERHKKFNPMLESFLETL